MCSCQGKQGKTRENETLIAKNSTRSSIRCTSPASEEDTTDFQASRSSWCQKVKWIMQKSSCMNTFAIILRFLFTIFFTELDMWYWNMNLHLGMKIWTKFSCKSLLTPCSFAIHSKAPCFIRCITKNTKILRKIDFKEGLCCPFNDYIWNCNCWHFNDYLGTGGREPMVNIQLLLKRLLMIRKCVVNSEIHSAYSSARLLGFQSSKELWFSHVHWIFPIVQQEAEALQSIDRVFML